jgi:hypothetical protein
VTEGLYIVGLLVMQLAALREDFDDVFRVSGRRLTLGTLLM